MTTTEEPAKPKKTYVTPQVTKVPLRPEEAVLGFCKNSSSTGPLQALCTSPAPCSSTGS